jgi:hypothetical protein
MGDEDGPVTTKAYFNSLMIQMAAMMEEIQNNKTKLEALSSGTISTTPLAPVDIPGKNDSLNKDKPPEEDLEKVDEDEGDENSPKKGDTPRGYSEIPHLTSYVSGRHIQMPHLASCGPSPPLAAFSFANWQQNMCSHINFVSIELWRIIEQGFNPTSKDLNNLLPWEIVDKQINASALHLIHMSLSEKDKALVRTITSSKETWDALTDMFIGNESIKSPSMMKLTMKPTTLPCLMVKILKNFIGISRLFK